MIQLNPDGIPTELKHRLNWVVCKPAYRHGRIRRASVGRRRQKSRIRP